MTSANHPHPADATGRRARLGILLLQTRFPRIPGDIGNPTTWPFPVRYRVVAGASPARVVRPGEQAAAALLPAFLNAADELVAAGVDGITTSCGFLAPFQARLAAHCRVPVATSALLQAASIQALLPPGRRVGIVTVAADRLDAAHLRAAGVPPGTPVIGTEGGREFSRVFLQDAPALNVELARRDVLDAGRRLVGQHPEVAALLLECTNMAPYSADLRQRFGLPVYDIYTFVRWFHAGLQPRRWPPSAGLPD